MRDQVSSVGMLLALLACFAMSACASQVDQDIGYRPSPLSAAKRPVHIAVVSDPTLEAQKLKLNPGLSSALQVGLSRAFDPVIVTDGASPPSDIDLIATPIVQVSAPTGGNMLMSVSFAEPNSRQAVAVIEYSAKYDETEFKNISGEVNAMAFLTGFSLLLLSPITVPVMVSDTNTATLKDLDRNLVLSVESVSDRAARDPALLGYTTHRILQAAGDFEHTGQQADAAGNHSEALADYIRALNSAPNGLPADLDFRIRQSAMFAARKMNPPPELSEEYRKQLVLGVNAVQVAKEPADFKIALGYLVQASNIAPWAPKPYHNMGFVLSELKDYHAAARYLRLYVAAEPSAMDARRIQDEIYILEAGNPIATMPSDGR
jgi:hypothetical protein